MTISKSAARLAAKKPSRRNKLKSAKAKRAIHFVHVIPCEPFRWSPARTALNQRRGSVLRQMAEKRRLLPTMSRHQEGYSGRSCSGHRWGSSCVSKHFSPTP